WPKEESAPAYGRARPSSAFGISVLIPFPVGFWAPVSFVSYPTGGVLPEPYHEPGGLHGTSDLRHGWRGHGLKLPDQLLQLGAGAGLLLERAGEEPQD